MDKHWICCSVVATHVFYPCNISSLFHCFLKKAFDRCSRGFDEESTEGGLIRFPKSSNFTTQTDHKFQLGCRGQLRVRASSPFPRALPLQAGSRGHDCRAADGENIHLFFRMFLIIPRKKSVRPKD